MRCSARASSSATSASDRRRGAAFRVKHKERLKELRSNVHVLTLSATPIPRTLQLALTGVRDLSMIATPPVDRLAVRTFIAPFDALTIREALLRERSAAARASTSSRASPTSADPGVPGATCRRPRSAVAHGQMPPGQLEDIMNGFYDGQYDILLSTTIVESGLDIPTANTLIVHRADMFGLASSTSCAAASAAPSCAPMRCSPCPPTRR
jgi:transcription-repair coupling factor (superfamily II helicase)